MLRNLRYALRTLRRQPGFAVVTILTLALGIGANTAVFSVVNAVVLRPLPYPSPERLAYITSQFPGLGFDQFWVSPPEFIEFRDHNHSFASVGAYATGAVNLGTGAPSRPVTGVVTPELMPTLGVRPLMGRWFTEDDSRPGAPDVAILSWELWQRSFGGRPGILEDSVPVDNVATRIVGIMPRGYDLHDQQIELWQPLTINPATLATSRGSHYLYLVGRLAPSVTLARADADLDVLLAQWRTIVPAGHVPDPKFHRMRIDPLKEDIIGPVRTALVVLQSAVGFVLLIACVNLANLLIARADTRLREYAVRAALGASRARLLGQLVIEGTILAIAASAGGLALGWAGLRVLLSLNPNAIPRATEISLDGHVLVFTLGVALTTGFVFGLVPLLHLRKDQAGDVLKDTASRSTTGAGRARLRSALVVAEVALAVLLVTGAGLLIRSFHNLTKVDVGFSRSQLTTFGLVLPTPEYTASTEVAFYDRLLASLRAEPGVQSVAAMSGLPPLRRVNANDTDFEDIPNNRPTGTLPVENVDFWQGVTVGYTDTMGIPLVTGRAFASTDIGHAPVVLVNEALVHRFFPDRDPIGRRLRLGFSDKSPWFTIVGVLKDVKQSGMSAKAGTELYLLNDQLPAAAGFSYGQMNIVVRSALPLTTLAPVFHDAVARLDATLPLVKLRAMDDVIDVSVARPRFLTLLLGIFAALALGLAAVGTYGILSYLVTGRLQEIGIRMALGADRRTILRLVLGRGLALSATGLATGLVASLALTRVMKTLLFNVTPTDPLTLSAVTIIIGLVAFAACLIPAWRATRVNPLAVLSGN